MAATMGLTFNRTTAGLLSILLSAGAVGAQSGSATHRHDAGPAKSGSRTRHDNDAASDPSHAVHDAMSGAMSPNPHMRMSPPRAASSADSARAQKLVDNARGSLAKYKDVRVAEREGYRMFAPNVKNQPVFHFTKLSAAVRERFKFDVAQPSSLLYKKDAGGSMRLVGAMYTAPKDATFDELNARVPLGIAQWHLHTNMCVPRLTQRGRWTEVRNAKPVFGPASPIATREACDSVDGKFLPVVFNWMVHANVFEDDIWGEHHH